MEDTQRTAGARSFGTVADAYAAHRPGYPVEAVHWLVPEPGSRVLELAAGTGNLTATLLDHEHRVVATDPTYQMLAHLHRRFRDTHAIQSAAEQIPVQSASMDVVVAAQAFHWFDHERAIPEIARVLRRAGTVSLVWNHRDETVPWVRKLSRILRSEVTQEDPAAQLEESGHFDGIETRSFRHWHQVDRESLLGLVRSRSYVATLADSERAEVLEQVGALYDDYGRGHDGMLLPYVTHCYRAHVISTRSAPEGPLGGLDDGLLIDFS